MDITEPRSVREIIAQVLPDTVILCAAYTDVDGCERNPEEAYRVNAFGAGNVASVCGEVGANLLFISTDYVFEGTKHGGYTEWDTPLPLSVYGASKLAGEQWVREVCPRHWIVRTAWLFGTGGRCFPRTVLNMARDGKSLRVVDDQIGSPTFTWDLAGVLLEMVQRSVPYGTYHVVNRGSATWYEVARAVLETAQARGLIHQSVSISPISSGGWLSPTRRPAVSVLKMERLRWAGVSLPRHWKEALQDYIQRLDL